VELDLYKIPITLPPPQPRKHMGRVALHALQYGSGRGVCENCAAAQSAFPAGSRIALVNKHNKERAMMDVLMVALALLFFAAAIGYTYACERL
jgi:hypothetical protein